MKTRVAVAGLVLLVIAAVLLFLGNKMLTALDACSLLRVCSQDMNPNSPTFSSSVATAQDEVALGAAFALAGILALVFGLTLKGRRDRGRRGDERLTNERVSARNSPTTGLHFDVDSRRFFSALPPTGRLSRCGACSRSDPRQLS